MQLAVMAPFHWGGKLPRLCQHFLDRLSIFPLLCFHFLFYFAIRLEFGCSLSPLVVVIQPPPVYSPPSRLGLHVMQYLESPFLLPLNKYTVYYFLSAVTPLYNRAEDHLEVVLKILLLCTDHAK